MVMTRSIHADLYRLFARLAVRAVSSTVAIPHCGAESSLYEQFAV